MERLQYRRSGDDVIEEDAMHARDVAFVALVTVASTCAIFFSVAIYMFKVLRLPYRAISMVMFRE